VSHQPTVSVVVPTYNEEHHLTATLESVTRQTYGNIVEVLVADGRSEDATRVVAQQFPGVRVLDNPARLQSAGLNVAIAAARGEIIVRVDGHCVLDDDYVERCVDALDRTGAAMVGGAMTAAPEVTRSGALPRGIARAMGSRFGAGPARFHVGGPAGWADTVYLGAYRTADARAVGGYATDVGVNEDSEFAIRMGRRGGVWFEPAIRSSYVPRASLGAVSRQFFRYGRSRVRTTMRHPQELRMRQLVAPALVVGLCSPQRRTVAALYAATVLAVAAKETAGERDTLLPFLATLPAMHLSWGAGFLVGLVSPPPAPTDVVPATAAIT
jgi:glycosyltransferase involved in cell wall biosynthesis